jgi:putative intracellular protease/amidase
MKVAILISPKDFKDETLSSLQLMFGKTDIDGVVASFSLKDCYGWHGAVVKPKAEARELEPNTYQALLIVDGPGIDSLKLYDYRPLLDLIKIFHDANRIVVGIGNSVKVIARSNIIKDTKIAKTDDREVEKVTRLYRGNPTEEHMVLDNKVLTLSNSDKIDELAKLLAASV